MWDVVIKGIIGDGVESVMGYIGYDVVKLCDYNEIYYVLFGYEMIDVVKGVIVINEVNVVMGIICVMLIVGFLGIIFGVFFKLEKIYDLIEE